MIVSFCYTSKALVAGAKTVTRRWWSDKHARWFQPGRVFDAYNRLPRVKGARKIAECRVVSCERTGDFPDADIAAEGFDYLAALGITAPLEDVYRWREYCRLRPPFVLRFDVIDTFIAVEDLDAVGKVALRGV